MTRAVTYFLRGLVVVVPLALTVYVCYVIFVAIDDWIPLPIPGAGFVLAIALIILTGFLASTILARSVLLGVEQLFERLPFVRLLYTSARDLMNAFVGEKRSFDKPVVVRLTRDGTLSAIGFLTRDSLAMIGLPDHVAVYVPQSYGFAGNILVIPRGHVRPLEADSAQVMAFIVSGAVTDISRHEARGTRHEAGG